MLNRTGATRPAIGVGLAYQLKRLILSIDLTPFRVALIYLLLGFAALYVSDVLFVRYFEEPVLSQVQAVKGAAEVGLTAILLFGLTRGSRYPLEIETDRLERQREELQVLHRVLRHNLRNDLNVISGYVELVRDNPDSPKRDEWCQQVLDGVEGLQHYTERAREIHQISAGDDRTRSFDLTKTVSNVLATNPAVTNAVDIKTTLPESAPVEANHKLPLAVDELVTNAIEHNDTETPAVELTVTPDRGPPASTQVIVEDNGPGIHRETIEVLERAREEQLLHHSGLGLWMVYWTVMASEGDLTIEPLDERGTRVVVTLPNAIDVPGSAVVKAVGAPIAS